MPSKAFSIHLPTAGRRAALVSIIGICLSIAAVAARADQSAKLSKASFGTVLSVAQEVEAEAAYEQRCGTCHNSPEGRMPSRGVIASMGAATIYDIIAKGLMQAHAEGLSDAQRRRLAIFLGGSPLPTGKGPDPQANKCATARTTNAAPGADWSYWGADPVATRFQTRPGFVASEVSRLKLKWAFAYPGGVASTGPIVLGGRMYVGSMTGQIFALDAATGCTIWSVNVGGPVKATLAVGSAGKGLSKRSLVYAVEFGGVVHALNANDGSPVWTAKVIDDPKLNSVSGTPLLHGDRLFVPITGQEDTLAADPHYGCCRSRGALAALNAATGALLWKTYPIAQEPKPTGKNTAGIETFGPAGAGIWTTPTFDDARGLVYVATGNDYSAPGSDASDAVLAIDPANGSVKWKRQVFKKDVWNLGCDAPSPVNCPTKHGPDLDFASPPMLRSLRGGRQLILIGSKSGVFYALDPDRAGEIVWQRRISDGDARGAIMFGPAADHRAVYVALSNPDGSASGARPGGMVALDIATGEILWTAPPANPVCHWGHRGCSAAQPAPLAAMAGLVFSGGSDGQLRAYDTRTGALEWGYDTGGSVKAVNGATARGGGIGRGGAVLANDMLYVNAGDGYGQAGNALLAFSVDGR